MAPHPSRSRASSSSSASRPAVPRKASRSGSSTASRISPGSSGRSTRKGSSSRTSRFTRRASTTSFWPRPAARSRVRPRRRKPRSRRESARAGRVHRAPLGGADGPPAREHHLPVRLPDGAARGHLGGAQSRDEDPRLPVELVPRVLPRLPVHPGRALRDDERRHRPRAGHPVRVPEPPGAHTAARRRADRRTARRDRGARLHPELLLPHGRADRRCPARIRDRRRDRPDHPRDRGGDRVRRARGVLRASHRVGRGGAGSLPASLRRALPVLDEPPAEPDRGRLVPDGGDVQSDLVPDRGAAQPDHRGLGLGGARARVRVRGAPRRCVDGACELGAPAEVDADVSRQFWNVAFAVAWRVLHNVFTTPSLFLPGMIFPLFFFTAFAGGLSRVDNIPGFDFPNGYTAFQFVFVLLQSAAFGGVFTGFGIARDFEYGFARRLLLAAPRRGGIVAGYAMAAAGRWAVTAVILTVVALAVGMQVGGAGVDLVALYALALIVSLAGTFWASGVAMRLRTVQAGPVMQLPVFLALFFAPVYVPLSLLSGWLHSVASVNPATALLEGGRSLISGSTEHVSIAFLVAFAMAVGLSVWAWRGLRSAERAAL